MAIIDDGIYAVRDGNMYKIIVPEPQFPGAKTVKIRLRPETNADRLRSMTDEELANFYFDFFFPQCPYCECDPGKPCPEHNDCKICLLEWLKKEASG